MNTGAGYGRVGRLAAVLFGFAALVVMAGSSGAAEPATRGVSITVTDAGGKRSDVKLYDRMVAVVIGIDRYPRLGPDLQLSYAVKDAEGFADLLGRKFRFDKVITLYNEQATRDAIKKTLADDLSRLCGDNDAVLIFFAGHGQTIRTKRYGDVGQIIPSDGSFDENESNSNISMDEIKTYISKKIPAKHVFYIFDSCYSGLLLRSGAASKPKRNAAYLREMAAEDVRFVLAAGKANQAVLDGGPLGHSVFTGRLIQRLEAANDYVTASELSQWIKERVFADAEARGQIQTPQSGQLMGIGDFVFVPKSPGAGGWAADPEPEPQPEQPAVIEPKIVRPTADVEKPAVEIDAVPSQVTNPSFTVTGRATDNRAGLMVMADGVRLPLDPSGRFRAPFNLKDGVNTLTFVARDATGNETTRTVEVEYVIASPAAGGTKQSPTPGNQSDVWTRAGAWEPEMVKIPGGTFQMGSNDHDYAQPVHTVEVEGFWMGKYEVTFEEFDVFCASTDRSKPGDEGWGRVTRPAINVSWDDATAYCKWLSGKTGRNYRLPTEAEWEYAARAGTLTRYFWGNDASASFANGRDFDSRNDNWPKDGYERTAPVGSFRPNGFGLYDMAGNVSEWCLDFYGGYTVGYSRNPMGPQEPQGATITAEGEKMSNKVVRGGAWYYSGDYLASFHRLAIGLKQKASGVGFRVAASARQ